MTTETSRNLKNHIYPQFPNGSGNFFRWLEKIYLDTSHISLARKSFSQELLRTIRSLTNPDQFEGRRGRKERVNDKGWWGDTLIQQAFEKLSLFLLLNSLTPENSLVYTSTSSICNSIYYSRVPARFCTWGHSLPYPQKTIWELKHLSNCLWTATGICSPFIFTNWYPWLLFTLTTNKDSLYLQARVPEQFSWGLV